MRHTTKGLWLASNCTMTGHTRTARIALARPAHHHTLQIGPGALRRTRSAEANDAGEIRRLSGVGSRGDRVSSRCGARFVCRDGVSISLRGPCLALQSGSDEDCQLTREPSPDLTPDLRRRSVRIRPGLYGRGPRCDPARSASAGFRKGHSSPIGVAPNPDRSRDRTSTLSWSGSGTGASRGAGLGYSASDCDREASVTMCPGASRSILLLQRPDAAGRARPRTSTGIYAVTGLT
jgi:hypothetical protein